MKEYVSTVIRLVIAIILLFALLVFRLPLYEDVPDEQNFHDQFVPQLRIHSDQTQEILDDIQASVELVSDETTRTYDVVAGNISAQVDFTDRIGIAFISEQYVDDTYALLQLPYAEMVVIRPQQYVAVVAQPNGYDVRGDQVAITGQFTAIYTDFVADYVVQRNDFMRAQIGNDIYFNPFVRRINQKLLELMAELQPEEYTDNLENFHAYDTYTPEQESVIFKYLGSGLDLSIDRATLFREVREGLQGPTLITE